MAEKPHRYAMDELLGTVPAGWDRTDRFEYSRPHRAPDQWLRFRVEINIDDKLRLQGQLEGLEGTDHPLAEAAVRTDERWYLRKSMFEMGVPAHFPLSWAGQVDPLPLGVEPWTSAHEAMAAVDEWLEQPGAGLRHDD